MATIRTAIQIFDGMTPAFRSMQNSMNMTISAFEQLQRTSGKAIDVGSIQAAREAIVKSDIAVSQLEQEIRQASEAQQKLNNDMRSGQGAASGLLDSVKGLAASLGAAFGIQQIFQLSDQMTQTTARLNLMNDKLQTTKELQDMIFASAQRSRASYIDTAGVVSKLGLLAGKAFSNNKEMVFVAEQINKQFKVGGSSIQEQTAAMYQLTQAMAAGRLQGDEFRSILENAPILAQSIEKTLREAGWKGTMKEASAEGIITANIIKKALFDSAEDINKKLSSLPMTWGDVWILTMNNIIRYSQPLLTAISWMANNWSMLQPIILGVAGAMGVYAISIYGVVAAQKALTFAKILAVPIYSLLTGATMTQTAAQWSLNTALYACPIAWVIMLIIALISIFYVAIAAVNKFKGTTYSATGVIAGLFYMLGASIMNNFIIPLWNRFASFVNFLGNVFQDPVAAVKVLFYDLAVDVIGYIRTMANAIEALINKIPGVRVNITAGLDDFYTQLRTARTKVKNESGWVEYVRNLDFWDYGGSYARGYNFGAGLSEKFKFNPADSMNIPQMLDNMNVGIGDTAGNTAKMADSMDIGNENLEYMRDLAEQEVIDRTVFRDMTIKVENSFGDIRETADIDGVINKMAEKLQEEMLASAEGVYS